ncbi:MAG: phospholipid carrier-dependent glycosyltransferase, partial [Aggregatilineales bacterium]
MKRALFALVILMIASMTLFAAGLDYGLPAPEYSPSTVQKAWLNGATVFHPDAFAYVGIGYRMMVHDYYLPSYYHNPSLNIYTDIALFWLSGALALPHNSAYGDREIAPFSLYVMAEFLSALFTLLGVALAYAVGRTAFDDRRVGVVTAALVAFSPLSVQHAHYATPNAETITFATAALLLGFVILKQKQPTLIVYLLGGLLIGLTASARYNAVIVGGVTILAMLTAWWKYRRWRPLLLGFAAIPVGFLIGTPGAIFERQKFVEDFFGILTWYKTQGGGPGFDAANVLAAELQHWRYTIVFVIGPVAALAAVVGLVLLLSRWRQNWRHAWIGAAILIYLLIYSFLALPGIRLNANLLLTLIAPLALLAAFAVVWLYDRFKRAWVGVLLALIVLGWPAYLSFRFAQLITTPDNRMLAQAWIYQHVPKGTPIHLQGSYNVPIDPLDYPNTQTYGFPHEPGKPIVPTDSPILIYSDPDEL